MPTELLNAINFSQSQLKPGCRAAGLLLIKYARNLRAAILRDICYELEIASAND